MNPETVREDAEAVLAECIWKLAFGRDPAKGGTARHIARRAASRLRVEGLLTGFDAVTTVSDAGNRPGDPPTRGVSHLVAEALVLLDLPVVSRRTVRALIPYEQSPKTIDNQFKAALRKFDQWKWIERREDGLIEVLNPSELANWFAIAVDPDKSRARAALTVATAATALAAEAPADEQRRRELRRLQSLMESAPGAVTNERGHVRVLAETKLL